MKRLLLLLMLLPFVALADVYYLAPDGDDGDDGSISTPWFTINQAKGTLTAGDTLYFRGGTYEWDTIQVYNNKSGTSDAYINFWAYPGESPVITPSEAWNDTKGIWIYNCDYIYIRGLEITGFTQRTTALHYGLAIEGSSYIRVESCKIHHNGFGLSIGDGGLGAPQGGHYILKCDLYSNFDSLSTTPWSGADGLTVRISTDSNAVVTVEKCRMWYNSDDGVDLFNFIGTINFIDCWAFWNGYKPDRKEVSGGDGNGFKSGPTYDYGTFYSGIRKTYTRCMAVENVLYGFDQNYSAAACAMYNCVAAKNYIGFVFNQLRGEYVEELNPDSLNMELDHRFANCISYDPVYTGNNKFGGFTDYCIFASNTWKYEAYVDGYAGYGVASDSVTLSSADFSSVSSTGMDGVRGAGDELPELSLYKLVSDSDLIDAGTDLGSYYIGDAPDLGAFEYFVPRGSSVGFVKSEKFVRHNGKMIR